jgi:hypothetical protein
MKLKPDTGFTKDTRIRGGKLYLEVNQKETGAISRFETEQPHSTLTSFEAEFNSTGGDQLDRGIYLTRALKPTSRSTAEGEPRSSIFLGVNQNGRVFWETHKYDIGNRDRPDEVKDSGVIDLELYGNVPLDPKAKLKLTLRRQLSPDESEVIYIAVINDYELRLPINQKADKDTHISDLEKRDFNQGRFSINCGFFTRAVQGTRATIEVERVKFVYDGGLAKGK